MTSPNCSGVDCGQDYKAGIKLHDDAIRQDERDKIYKRLDALSYQDFEAGSKIPVVNWPDIDCLFAELRGEE